MHNKKLRGQLLGIYTSNIDEKDNIRAVLVQCLGKRSIKMLNPECQGNGPEAWKCLTAHFSSSKTRRVMNSSEQLMSLSLRPSKEMSDYLTRADILSSSLEVEGEEFRTVVSLRCF